MDVVDLTLKSIASGGKIPMTFGSPTSNLQFRDSVGSESEALDIPTGRSKIGGMEHLHGSPGGSLDKAAKDLLLRGEIRKEHLSLFRERHPMVNTSDDLQIPARELLLAHLEEGSSPTSSGGTGHPGGRVEGAPWAEKAERRRSFGDIPGVSAIRAKHLPRHTEGNMQYRMSRLSGGVRQETLNP
eukprot:CAMPEP_0182909742 /NCGR_PEP_ID=MMETSP0034_2-20130328/35922_1 /TAXON_ID=156128 /ORGANISM="Nephroselmis pyriformis, Strain CCMP717" /LENGTH=184 /DNA_ID=CAMNT_0025046015 /DNA_START=178 /DNA_END=732 /DNA_ORIENTATION=-